MKQPDVLHITNGDSAVDVIRRAGLPGEVLPWRDVLHEGPVPPGLSLDELRPIRARFIAGAGWGELDDVLAGFAGRDIGATRLGLVCGAEYLGASTRERLAERLPERQEISPAQLALGQTAWAAFRSPDPRPLAELLRQDTSALPFLGGALRRHLQQFPSIRNGLSRSEAQALQAIARGVTRLGDVYIAAHHEREEAIFLGDLVFAWYVAELSQGREPLVLKADGRPLAMPGETGGARAFWNSHVALTEVGRAILNERADRVEINGIDRWLGGVHLQGHAARWRWHDAAQGLHGSAS